MDTEERSTTGLIAAAVVILVVVALVAAFGIERYPELPEVGDGRDAPGRVAFLSYGRRTCLNVAEPDGQVRELRCDDHLHGPVETEDGSLLLYRWGDPGQVVDVIDPATGEVLETRVVDPGEDPHAPRPGTSRDLFTGGEGDTATLGVAEGDTVVTVLRLEGPSHYAFHQAVRSPGGDHAAVVDSGGRLLLVSLTDAPDPRLWAEDASEVVWIDQD